MLLYLIILKPCIINKAFEKEIFLFLFWFLGADPLRVTTMDCGGFQVREWVADTRSFFLLACACLVFLRVAHSFYQRVADMSLEFFAEHRMVKNVPQKVVFKMCKVVSIQCNHATARVQGIPYQGNGEDLFDTVPVRRKERKQPHFANSDHELVHRTRYHDCADIQYLQGGVALSEGGQGLEEGQPQEVDVGDETDGSAMDRCSDHVEREYVITYQMIRGLQILKCSIFERIRRYKLCHAT